MQASRHLRASKRVHYFSRMLDNRHRILQAAAKVYAQLGWRGATTRRIAEEAGVNEVTLFRQFGSKEALLDQAMRECSRIQQQASLPAVPVAPAEELAAWAAAHHAGIGERRELVRQLMSDALERPDAAQCAKGGPSSVAAQLREYVVRLRRHGWLADDGAHPADVSAAVTMLMSAIFADALNRDMMPELYAQPVARSLASYVRIFLRGLGVRAEPPGSAPRTDHADARGATLPVNP
jgi:AcrR family transcriptional regulator